MIKRIKSIFILSFLPFFAIAANVETPTNITKLEDFLKVLLEGIVNIMTPVLVLAIIYVGFLFIVAQGNDQKLKAAKEAFMYLMVGIGIVIISEALYKILYSVHGKYHVFNLIKDL